VLLVSFGSLHRDNPHQSVKMKYIHSEEQLEIPENGQSICREPFKTLSCADNDLLRTTRERGH